MAVDPRIALVKTTPDIGKTFSNVLLNVGRFDDIKRAREADEVKRQELERQAQVRQALGQIGAPEELIPGQAGPTQILSQDELIQQARQIDPVFANKQLEQLGLDDPAKRAEASRFAAEIQSLPLEQQNQRIKQRIQELSAQGRDPSDTAELLGMDSAQRAQTLQGVQLLDLSTKERLTLQQKKAKLTAEGAAPAEVQSSKILEGGAVQIVRKDGTVEIKPPDEVGADIVRRAEERGVDLQQRRAQGRELGKEAGKISSETVKQARKLRSNNIKLRKVISLVGDGAETGPLAAKLPNFRAESVRLEQLRRELGLDVIGSVTFGALSESEMNLALDTALPEKLEGPELIKWANDKIEAQEKLADYLEDQAIFLGRRGNTPALWLEEQRRRAERIAVPEPAPAVTPTPPAAQPQIQEGATATNPTTGQKVIFTNGQWQPAS